MLSTFVALAGLTLAQQTDTTITVEPGTRLSVTNYGGEVVVRTGAENRVRVRASYSSRTRVEIVRGSQSLTVRTEGRRGQAGLTDLELTVPRSTPLNLSGVYTHIVVDGVDANVAAETVEGDVSLVGGSGAVTLRSVEGEITVRGARGRLDVGSVDGDVRISETTAEITAETVDGDIFLQGIDAAAVDANTVDGDIYYEGAIKNAGRYRFATHDGDVTVGVPEGASVTVAVSTFEGEFDASFPVQISETRRRRFSFTLGSGSARLELETFDGDIRLRRPAEVRPGERNEKNRNQQRNKNQEHDDW
ncbi:MAG: DUF4097 family beta strand repeat-containing protein [Gemmatimonadales bacterium]